MSRSASILAIIALAASFSANAQETVKLYNTAANYREFSGAENGNYNMCFSSYFSRQDFNRETVYTHADADGNYWEVLIDLWSDDNSGILAAGTYENCPAFDMAGTIYSDLSVVRKYDQWGDLVFEANLPETLVISKDNERYSFSFTVGGIRFEFGAEDKDDAANIVFTNNGAVAQTFEEYLEEMGDYTGDYLIGFEQPATPTKDAETTAIDSVKADAQAISFSGNTITLSTAAATIIADMNGRVVLRATASSIDLSALSAGCYIAHCAGQSLKFMKN